MIETDEYHEVLYSKMGLSFWGGIDPITGIIIDHSHPLCGLSVTDKVLWYVNIYLCFIIIIYSWCRMQKF